MITVKSQRADTAATVKPDRHALKEDLSPYRLPAMVALMLGSLMLYLRSFLPVRADVVDANPGPNPFEDSAEKGRVGPVDAPASVTEGADVAERTPQSSPFDTGTEGGSTSLRGRGNASQQDANVLKADEVSAYRALTMPANTNFPDMPRDSLPRFPAFTGGPGGGNSGNGGNPTTVLPGNNGNNGNNGSGPDIDPEADDPVIPPARNRAPRNNGPVYLADVATGAVLAIALTDLLRNSSDEDGDTLTVTNLRSSSGTITAQPDGSWIFTPSPTNLGRTVISFDVTDGMVVVPQMAFTMVNLVPVDTGGGDDTGPGGDGDGDPDGDTCGAPGSSVTGYNPVIGGVADDVLIGTEGNDLIRAGAGHDTAFGGLGDDLIYGGDGRDQLSGGAGNDQIFGEADDDILFGDDGDDALDGGAGHDVVHGGAGDDTVFGAEGDDVLAGGQGADQMSGGAGADLMDGEGGDDILFGDAGADVMLGAAGRDILDGGEGNDTLDGGADADVMAGGAGDDVLSGNTGADLVQGDAGDDQLAGGEGDDVLLGGDGADDLSGNAGDDTLQGGAGNDHIRAGEGHDVAADGAGADIVLLAAGDDWVAVALDLQQDHFDGGSGTDTLDLSAAAETVVFDLISGMVSTATDDADTFSGFEAFVGGSGDDHFIAASASAVFTGGDGDDRFQFDAVTAPNQDPDAAVIDTIFQITDFDVGDRVSISRFDFFKDLKDHLEDQFDSYFSENGNSGPGNNDPRIRIRHDHDEDKDADNTWIEIDFDRDNFFETTITMQGHHLFVVVENEVTPV